MTCFIGSILSFCFSIVFIRRFICIVESKAAEKSVKSIKLCDVCAQRTAQAEWVNWKRERKRHAKKAAKKQSKTSNRHLDSKVWTKMQKKRNNRHHVQREIVNIPKSNDIGRVNLKLYLFSSLFLVFIHSNLTLTAKQFEFISHSILTK